MAEDLESKFEELSYIIREAARPGSTEKVINGALAFGFNPRAALRKFDAKLADELHNAIVENGDQGE